MELLRQPRPAGTCRSRLLSGRAALYDLVVPLVLPLADDGPVPVRQRDLAVHRTAARRLAAANARLGRIAWLAVALHHRGHSADHHVFGHLSVPDRQAE